LRAWWEESVAEVADSVAHVVADEVDANGDGGG
jgi:hypothetical protein